MNITTIIRKREDFDGRLVNVALPYQVQIDKLQGIGNCPASAVMAALSVGRKIPLGMRDRKKAVKYILETYPIDREWLMLIRIIENNKFE